MHTHTHAQLLMCGPWKEKMLFLQPVPRQVIEIFHSCDTAHGSTRMWMAKQQVQRLQINCHNSHAGGFFAIQVMSGEKLQ